MRVNTIVAHILMLALPILVTLGFTHTNRVQQKAKLALIDYPKRLHSPTGKIIHHNIPPTWQEIGEAIKILGGVQNFKLFGWVILIKEIHAEGLITRYQVRAIQKDSEVYLYRITRTTVDVPFAPVRILIEPPVVLPICADGAKPDNEECDDRINREFIFLFAIGR